MQKWREEPMQQLNLLTDGIVGQKDGQVVVREDARLVLDHCQRKKNGEGPSTRVLGRIPHR